MHLNICHLESILSVYKAMQTHSFLICNGLSYVWKSDNIVIFNTGRISSDIKCDDFNMYPWVLKGALYKIMCCEFSVKIFNFS